MKIVVVGATRTIGTAVVSALEAKHEVIRASRRGLPLLSKITVSWTSLDWSDGRDALPRDPRQDVQWLSSGAALLIVYAFRRVRRRTSADAFQTCDAGRARVHLRSEAGTPDMTIRRPAADRAGARPYLRRRPSSSVLLFLGLHTRKQSLLASPFFRTLLGQECVESPGGTYLNITHYQLRDGIDH
jgi:hypothetical protein